MSVCRIAVVMVALAVVAMQQEGRGLGSTASVDSGPSPEGLAKAKRALDHVQRTAALGGNCTFGVENTLDLQFNTSVWRPYAIPAVRNAILLSHSLARNNKTLQNLPDDLLYNMVLDTVHADPLIFGAAIAWEEKALASRNRTSFCPYASTTPQGTVKAFDLALSYNYSSDNVEWYGRLRVNNFSGVHVVNESLDMNRGEGPVSVVHPVVSYSDGAWTKPYYDCGAGNVWMVTYSAPVLALIQQGQPAFMGVTTIDLELTNIDINQCDADNNHRHSSFDVFRGTHLCVPTTKCTPIADRGFTRGSYLCECKDGYYFPDSQDTLQAYRGTDIEQFFSTLNHSSPDSGGAMDRYRCLKCADGCDTCQDDTPCLYEVSHADRVFVAVLVCVTITGCVGLSLLTFLYRTHLVMKTASPLFLQIMICGAIFMCSSVFVMYPEPDDVLCTVYVWPYHLGFSLLYGSLLLKTWRISVIFSSGKTRRVKLPDTALLRRLVPLLMVMLAYLVCRTVWGPPRRTTVTMETGIKFFYCSFHYWDYAVHIGEAVLLLYGVYLCFTVRKAPAFFNESKYITWATYNAIILGSFTITLVHLLSEKAGPNVVYLLLMLNVQVLVTITLGLIFIPKIWMLHHGTPQGRQMSITGMAVNASLHTISSASGFCNAGIQVDLQDLQGVLPSDVQLQVQ